MPIDINRDLQLRQAVREMSNELPRYVLQTAAVLVWLRPFLPAHVSDWFAKQYLKWVKRKLLAKINSGE